jgi:hypothetical protein
LTLFTEKVPLFLQNLDNIPLWVQVWQHKNNKITNSQRDTLALPHQEALVIAIHTINLFCCATVYPLAQPGLAMYKVFEVCLRFSLYYFHNPILSLMTKFVKTIVQQQQGMLLFGGVLFSPNHLLLRRPYQGYKACWHSCNRVVPTRSEMVYP